jgi:hypothetical protein
VARVNHVICLVSILLAGCSTIVKSTEQQISVNTPVAGRDVSASIDCHRNPHGANAGEHNATKSKHNVAVSCTAQCYSPGVSTLASHTEVMTAGNVVFGGLIGLGIDAASGAMNTYDPNVEIIMTPLPGCGSPPREAKGVPMAKPAGAPG